MAQKITQLNQTAERITSILDQVDAALKQENSGKFWKINSDGTLTYEEVNNAIFVDELPLEAKDNVDYYLKHELTEDGEVLGTYYLHYRHKTEISITKDEEENEVEEVIGSWIHINDIEYYTSEAVKAALNSTSFIEVATAADNASKQVESLTTTVGELQTEVGNQGISITEHASDIASLKNIAAEYSLTYSDDYLSLWKDQNGVTEIVGSPIKIVSASEVVSSVITVTRITPASNTVTLQEPGVIEYKVESLQEGVETGDITVTWKVNNVTVLVETVKQGTNTFDLKNVVSAGNNGITATFVDTIGTSYTTRWSVDVIDMYITSTFNDTVIYEKDATVSFTAFGMVAKTIYFLLDGKEIYNTTITTSGVQSSYTITHQKHGAHSLEIYCKATMNNGREIESTHLYYDIMFVDADETTPIIRWPYDGEALTQYQATTFNYSVYTPNSLTSAVELYINGEKISSLTVSRNAQTWVYKPQAAGEDITFTIKTGEVEKTKILDIIKFPYDVSPVTGAVIDFNPTGRTNNDENYTEWTDGTYSMSVSEGFDWNNGGWKVDSNGDSYFCVKAGSRMMLNFPLFESEQDVKLTGKNMKFIFKTTNNRKIKDTAISCLSSKTISVDGVDSTTYIGLNIGTQEANLHAETASLEVQYVEDEKLELEFNISPSGDRQNMLLGYINSDPVRVGLYTDTASFTSYTSGLPITFGSDSCDVHLYRFKVYNEFLSDKAIMQNYIADATNSDDMVERYERNDILDEAGEELDYNKLSKLYPDLRILLITCPRFTFDKDDKVKGCTVQHLMGNGEVKHNWTATNVQIKGQGTSSNEYGTSARNIDIKLNKVKINGEEQDYAFVYGDEVTTGKKYAMTENSVAVNYFNIKVNVASSENANNARLAQRFFEFNPYVRQARLDNPKVRDTMEFHPCVIFIKELGSDTEYGNQEFEADGKFHFYACGDFGNSKKNHEAFGMDIDAYDNYDKAAKDQNIAVPVDAEGNPLPMPTEAIIEISNNTSPGCLFKFTPGWDEILPDEDPNPVYDDQGNKQEVDIWGGDVVEFRYPEDLFDIIDNEDNEFTDAQVQAAKNVFGSLKNEVRRLWNWVASTDTTTATNNALETSVTYAGVEYTTDSIDYRKAKFINEYTQYFEPKSLLYNYLFTDRYLMVDNRAKNVFIHTIDGLIWDLCFDYDNDTSLGCDNRGGLKFEYYYEDTDEVNNEMVFNASESVLWTNVRDCLFDQLKAQYQSSTFHTATGTLTDFNNYQWQKPERLQMFDMRRKYLRPYQEGHYGSNIKEGKIQSYAQYLPMMNGRKTYQRQAFEKYREAYMNSKYQVVSDSEALQFRATTRNTEQPLTITPYCWLYVQADFDNARTPAIKTPAGQPCVLKVPVAQGKLEDKNTHIYHPRWLEAVDGLDQFYIRDANFDYGVKLSKLILGSSEEGYSNVKAEINLSIGGATLLEELNVCGWSSPATWALQLNNNTNLKRLYTTNTNMSSVTFADGGLLEEAKLNAITAVNAMNLKNLETFEVANLTALTQARLENSPIVTSKEFLEQCTNLVALRLIGIDWKLDDTSLLEKFLKMKGKDENGYDTTQSIIAGKVHVDTIKESQLWNYQDVWPNLAITYTTLVPQWLVTYEDWDGTILYQAYSDNGSAPYDPVALGLIEIPTRESSISTVYTFSGWSGDMESLIESARTYRAIYTETPRTYIVNWWKDKVDGTLLKTQTYDYGSDAIYIDENNNLGPLYNTNNLSYSLFLGWDKSTSYIEADLDVIAQWESGYLSADSNNETIEPTTLNAAQLYNLVQRDRLASFFQDEDGAPNGERIAIPMGFRPKFTNLNSQVLISTPTYFDGTKNTVIDTNIKLFEEDKDWTLLIDGQFDTSVSNKGTLVSSYFSTGTSGLRFYYSGTSGLRAPAIVWGSNETGVSGWEYKRDMFIARHKKGETSIDVFIGDLVNNIVLKKTLTKAVETKHNITLTFGAEKNNAGAYSNYGKGTLYNVILWENYLGDSDCKELAKWPWDTFLFDVVSFGDYLIDDNYNTTSIDFYAAQCLPFTKTSGVTSTFADSSLYNWLNSRFLSSMPKTWQAIFAKPYVNYTKYNSTTLSGEVLREQMKIWLPARYEIAANASGSEVEPYPSEGGNKLVYTSSWTRRYALGAALKEFNPSSLELLKSKDWAYEQDTDPILDADKTITNGDVWINGSSYKVFKDNAWYTYGVDYHLRTITLSSGGKLQHIGTTGYFVYDNTTDYDKGILPCFSLSKQ